MVWGVRGSGFEKSLQNLCSGRSSWLLLEQRSGGLGGAGVGFLEAAGTGHRGPHSYLLVGSMWKWDGSDSDLGSVV